MSKQPGSILHIIDTTGPGGAETVFTQLAAHTQDIGYRSIAVIRGPGWVLDELTRLGVKTHVIDCKGSFNFRFLNALRKLVKHERISLIQAHLLGSSLYASLAGLITGTPVVSTFHGHVDVSPTERMRSAKFLIIQLGSKAIISVTDQLGTMLKNVSTVSEDKVKTIPNGIDTTVYTPGPSAPLRKEYKIAASATLLGCLGNVRTAKNYDLAIDTLKVLITEGRDTWLLIAGDDTKPLAQQHKKHAEELGIADRVIWLGFYRDTPAFLNAIDVFLLSSSSEGHPLALTQAMATGVPIVATRCGVEEIVTHRKTAMLAENHNANDLAAAITEITENESLRTSITNEAQALAKDALSLKAMYDKYTGLYHTLTSGATR